VRATRDLAKEGALPVTELFLNLDPVWTVVEMFAPPEVKSVLDTCALTSIHGISACAAMGATGIDDFLFIDSPEGRDVLTRAVAGRQLDTKIARFLPPEAPVSALQTLDVQFVFDTVRKLLPDQQKRSLDARLDEMEKQGFDLRNDLIANIGPTFGISGDADCFSRLGQGQPVDALDMTFVVQLKDPARLRALIDHGIATAGIGAHVHSREMYGFTTSRLDALPIPGRDGSVAMMIEPSWCIADNVFLYSLTNAGLGRTLAHATETDAEPGPIQSALAEHGADAFFVTSYRAGGAAGGMVGRRTPYGIELGTKAGNGTTCGITLVGAVALASSVAIPKIMSGRLETNEATAMSTLRTIERAERDFRAARFDDLDRDGRGEFGTLGELTGASGLRCLRPALSNPLLPVTMQPDKNDCFTLSGYVFRIDVARRLPRDVDDDEREFIAYAWPSSPGMSGNHVFSIDAEGRLMRSDNAGDGQHYSGIDRTPMLDTSKRALNPHPLIGIRGRVGRDGGVWEHVD
jgi:hypothetical protein